MSIEAKLSSYLINSSQIDSFHTFKGKYIFNKNSRSLLWNF